MPTYEFMHQSEDCNHEWDVWQKMSDPNPAECPKCKGKENIIKLISGGSGKGKVELYGQDVVDKNKRETEQLKKDIHSNENLYANVLGPDKYHQMQTRMDRNKREKY